MNTINPKHNTQPTDDAVTRSVAIINAKAPYSACSGKDALDVALIFGSYEQDISLFFHGDGVFQLIEQQNAVLIQLKDYLKTFAAFEFYDIEKIYVCQKSLEDRRLTHQKFHIGNTVILTAQAFSEKLHQHKIIFRF